MRWSWILVTFLGLFYFGLADNVRGPIYPHALSDLAISSSLGSLLFALSSIAGLIISLAARWWLPFTNSINWMKFSWPLIGLGLWLTGYSYKAEAYWPFYLGSFIQGLGGGFLGMSMNLIVAQSSTTGQRRQIFGGLHAAYGIASLSAPFLYSFFYQNSVHWSDFLTGLSYLSFLLLILTWKIKGEQKAPSLRGKVDGMMTKQIYFGAILGLYVASEIVVSSRLVYYLIEGKGMAHELASSYLAGFFFCLTAGRLLIAFSPLNIKGEKLMLGSLITSLFFLGLGMAGQSWAFSVVGLTMSAFFPCAMDCLSGWFPKDVDAMVAGAMSGVGVFLVIMHLLFGQFVQYFGIVWAMSSSLLFAFISLSLLMLFLSRLRSQALLS